MRGIKATPFTLTTISTPVSGWDSVEHAYMEKLTLPSTSLTIPNLYELITFNVGPDRNFEINRRAHVGESSAPGSNYFSGSIKSYDSLTGDLTLQTLEKAGSGTYSSWVIYESWYLEESIGTLYPEVEPESITTTFTLSDTTINGDIEVLYENRAVTATNGVFSDTFDRNAAHIYRYPAGEIPDPPSPQTKGNASIGATGKATVTNTGSFQVGGSIISYE